MGGTWATYQGFPVRCDSGTLVLRLSRGIQADSSYVDIYAEDLLKLYAFPTGQLGTYRGMSPPDTSAIDAKSPGPAPELGKSLAPEGDLMLLEVVGDQRWPLFATQLYVRRIETLKRSAGGTVAIWRVHLTDVRYFWTRGVLKRWSFNRPLLDGVTLAKDSLGENGKAVSLAWIAEYVVGSLFHRPELSACPEAWKSMTGPRELEPGASTLALARICADEAIEDPCLRWDRSVALHATGDGVVAACQVADDGRTTGPNKRDVSSLALWRDQPSKLVREPTWCPDFAIVFGGPRIASIAVDDWLPVLCLPPDGRPVPLNEATVRRLTKGKQGLDWLRKWILAPPSFQHTAGLGSAEAKVLREQAWKLWQLPGAFIYEDLEVESKAEKEKVKEKVDKQKGADPLGLMRQAANDCRRVPGPLHHLLPLLATAETRDEKRLPVIVARYGWEAQHVELANLEEWDAIGAAKAKRDAAREAVVLICARVGKPDPWQWNNPLAEVEATYPEPDWPFAWHLLDKARFEACKATAARIKLAKTFSAEAGAEYEKAHKDWLKERDKLAGTRDLELFEIAAKALEASILAGKKEKLTNAQYEAIWTGIKSAIHDLGKKVAADAKATKILDELGQQRGTHKSGLRFVNLEKQIDERASVYSADLGIVRTSEMAGRLESTEVGAPLQTTFCPGPVRVVFGTRCRPRVDKGQGAQLAMPDHVDYGAKMVGGDHNLNAADSSLKDWATFYQAAWKRSDKGPPGTVDPESVPTGEALAIKRPDLVELIPLNGAGNRNTLSGKVYPQVWGLMYRPAIVESASYVFARPLPINPDGLVASVEIRSRSAAQGGFETEVVTGLNPRKRLDQTAHRLAGPSIDGVTP